MKNFKSTLRTVFIAWILGTAATCIYAQNTTYADDYWLDWKETEITSFPDFDLDRAINIEAMPGSRMNWFIDPKTITIDKDSVVRYVVIATSNTGAQNAMYEGILCAQNTYKIYARAVGDGGWRAVVNAEWKNLRDAPALSHERMIAQIYMCENASRPRSVESVIRRLRTPYASQKP